MSEQVDESRSGAIDIDLASLRGPKGTFGCRLFFDSFQRADYVDVIFPIVSELINAINSLWNEPERFRDQNATITLDNGTSVDVTLAIVGGSHDVMNVQQAIMGGSTISHTVHTM